MPLKNFSSYILEPDGSQYAELEHSGDFTETGAPLFRAENGKAIKKPVTLGTVIGNLLKSGLKDEKISSHEAIENWNLMKRIASGGNIQLTGKQVDYIEKLLLKSMLHKFIIGQICQYLNEPEKSPEKIANGIESSGSGMSL